MTLKFTSSLILILTVLGLNLQAQCDFTISNNTPCGGTSVTFTVANPAGFYSWDFDGDGVADAYGSVGFFTYPIASTNIDYNVTVSLNGIDCQTHVVHVLESPEASIGVLPGTGNLDGNLIRVCNGDSLSTLSIYNTSGSYANNLSYEIDWGDGTIETFDNSTFSNTNNLDHVYNGFGYYDMTINVTSVSGCTAQSSYLIYSGSNPSVGLANPGNTTGLCAPATITFPITNTQSNTAGTIYNIYVSGELIETYTQENVPSEFIYTFLSTSCGINSINGNYQNAYDVQIEATNPCGSSQAIIAPIEVSARPDLEFDIDGPDYFCTDQTFTITNTSTGIAEIVSGEPSSCETSLAPSWQISPGVPGIDWDLISGNLFNSENIDLAFYLPGDYTITMTATSSACGGGTFSQNISILETPVAGAIGELNTAASPGADECIPTVGTFTDLSVGDSITTTWNVVPANGWQLLGTSDFDQDILELSFTEAGSYTVSLNASSECSSSVWDTTFVIASTPELYLSPIPDNCETAVLDFNSGNTSFDANGGTISSYAWQFPGATPEFSNIQYPSNIVYNTPGEYIVFLTVENQCGPETVSDTFNIQPEGILVLSDDMIICEGEDAITLDASPSGGVWSGNGVTSAGLFTPSDLTIGQNTIYYDFNQGTCSMNDSLVILVTAIPEVDPGGAQALCIDNDPTLITGGTPAGGIWTSDNGGVISGHDLFDPGASGIGVYNLTYTFTNSNNCENSATKTIVVADIPDVEAGPGLSICLSNVDVQITGFSPPGGSWSGTGITSDGYFNASNTPGVGTYMVYYTFSDPSTMCTNLDSAEVSVTSSGTVDAGPDLDFCIDAGTIDLNDNTTNAGGIWSANGSNGLFGSIFNPNDAGVGTHILTYSVGSGSCIVTDNIEITINALPTIEAGPNFSICLEDDPLTLNNYNPQGGIWTGIGITDTLLGIFDPAGLPSGDYTLTYRFKDGNNCSAQDQRTITIQDLPVVQAPNDSLFCDAPVQVQLNQATPFGGIWTGPALVDDELGIINPSNLNGTGTYSYVYEYTDPSSQCSNVDSMEVLLTEISAINAGPNDTICVDAGNIVFAGFSPTGGVWSGPGLVDSLAGEIDPTLIGGGSHIFTYTYGAGSCLVEDFKLVKIIDITNIDVGDEISVCFTEDPFVLTALNSPDGGVWEGNGIIDQVTGLFDPGAADIGFHTVTYTFTDGIIGCTAILTKEIQVLPMEVPDFEVIDIACANQTVVFNNLSNTTYDAFWDFGDGETAIDFSPVHIYQSTGTFTVTLVTENIYACRDTISKEIFITQSPAPSFALDTYEGCAPVEIAFTNQSSGYEVDFLWDFGNDSTSTEIIPPTQTYYAGANDTTYYVTLSVNNLCGTIHYTDSITVKSKPLADFGTSPESTCSPMEVSFANVSTGSAETFYWEFGNGFTSDLALPSNQTFIANDTTVTYTIGMIAWNECGVDTAYRELEVDPAGVEAFFNASTLAGCQPLTVDFSNFATPGANIDWDFGDGNSSAELNPMHTFDETGQFKVVQYASSDCGYDTTSLIINVLPQPTVSFNHPTYVCVNEEFTFENNSTNTSGNIWDFGDGDTSLLSNPTHFYSIPGTYTVTLTGISLINQCQEQYTSEIIVRDLPIAAFEPSTINGCMPLIIDFENTSVESAFYQWDFGDGNSSGQENPNHTFDSIGTYEVRLVATDDNGCFNDTSFINIMVLPIPDAEFEFDRTTLCSLPADIQFENQSEGAVGYNWSFGDGSETDLNNPLHSYFEEGTYEISLVASNQYNCLDTASQTINIYPEPVADFEITGAEGCTPVTVEFENNSIGVDQYLWTFDDGSTSDEANPTHTFKRPGEYNVQLVVSINDACFDTMQLAAPVKVHPTPFANFEAIPLNEETTGGNYQFYNNSQYADEYYWEFSDGFTSTELSPSHRFLTNGARQILLEAYTEYGCFDDTLVTFIPEFFGALHIPNGFSPEQGIGEVALFKPKGVGLKEYSIQVFSPYGQLLWESEQLIDGQPAEAWDGTVNGQLLPQDVYVWKAWGIFENGTQWIGSKDKKGRYTKMGSVILLR